MESAEKYLVAFIRDVNNSAMLKHILMNSNNPMTLFITVELLTKTFLVDTGIGIIECRFFLKQTMALMQAELNCLQKIV